MALQGSTETCPLLEKSPSDQQEEAISARACWWQKGGLVKRLGDKEASYILARVTEHLLIKISSLQADSSLDLMSLRAERGRRTQMTCCMLGVLFAECCDWNSKLFICLPRLGTLGRCKEKLLSSFQCLYITGNFCFLCSSFLLFKIQREVTDYVRKGTHPSTFESNEVFFSTSGNNPGLLMDKS